MNSRNFWIFIAVSIILHVAILKIDRREFPIEFAKGNVWLEVFAVVPAKSKSGLGSTGAIPEPVLRSSGIVDGAEFGILIPTYPVESQRRGEEGIVVLHLRLGKEKRLIKIDISESSGFEDLDRAAVNAVKKSLLADEKGEVAEARNLRFIFRLNH